MLRVNRKRNGKKLLKDSHKHKIQWRYNQRETLRLFQKPLNHGSIFEEWFHRHSKLDLESRSFTILIWINIGLFCRAHILWRVREMEQPIFEHRAISWKESGNIRTDTLNDSQRNMAPRLWCILKFMIRWKMLLFEKLSSKLGKEIGKRIS